MEENCYPWGLKDTLETHHLDQPHNSATGSYSPWGASHCHDPMLGGSGSTALDGESLSLDERIDPNMIQQVTSLLEDKFPDFPYFPMSSDPEMPNSATQDSDMLPSATHPQCQREGSSAINVLDEMVVAGVNGVMPGLDDGVPICVDVKPYISTSTGVPGSATVENQLCIGSSGEIRVPISAKGENQAYIGTSGEAVNTKANHPYTGTTENQIYESTSGVPTGAKSGSQAIDYIRCDAVLETNGIPAFSPLALNLHIPGTDVALPDALAPTDQGTSIKRTMPGMNTDGTSSADTTGSDGVLREGIDDTTIYPSGTVLNRVPEKDLDGTQDKPAILEGLMLNQFGVVLGTVPDAKILPQLTGTQHTKLGTFIDPQKVEIIRTLSTVSIDPNKIVPEVSPGTVTYSPESIGTAYDTNATDTVDDEQDNGVKNAKKRIRKRKKTQGAECQKKVPKYKQEKQNDAIEERKRQDAMRAKRGRDRNRQKMEDLQETNTRLEEENRRLTEEVEGRRRWEMALLAVFRGHGIVVAPYGTGGASGHQISPTLPVTSPAQALVTSPAQLPMMSPATPNR